MHTHTQTYAKPENRIQKTRLTQEISHEKIEEEE